MTSYILAVLFLDTGVTVEYKFPTKAQCEQVKPAVMQLYTGLRQPVRLTCKARQTNSREYLAEPSLKM